MLWRRTRLCHKDVFGFFARVSLCFFTARVKTKFWRSVPYPENEMLLPSPHVPPWRWLPQSFPQTKPQHNKQLLLPLTGEKHLGCDSSPDSFFQHFCTWASAEGAAPVCVGASGGHNVHSHGTDCRALTKLAVTALPGVTYVWQDDTGEGVCNKKSNEFHHHREPFNCFATKLNTGIQGNISRSVYFKEIFLKFKG